MDQQQQQQQAPLEPIDHDAAAAAAAEIGVKYVCGDCGGENVIKARDAVRCRFLAATASSTRSARSASSSSRPADGAAVSRHVGGRAVGLAQRAELRFEIGERRVRRRRWWRRHAAATAESLGQEQRPPPSRTNLILVTHLHGDHAFGLPGLVVYLDNAATEKAPP